MYKNKSNATLKWKTSFADSSSYRSNHANGAEQTQQSIPQGERDGQFELLASAHHLRTKGNKTEINHHSNDGNAPVVLGECNGVGGVKILHTQARQNYAIYPKTSDGFNRD